MFLDHLYFFCRVKLVDVKLGKQGATKVSTVSFSSTKVLHLVRPVHSLNLALSGGLAFYITFAKQMKP